MARRTSPGCNVTLAPVPDHAARRDDPAETAQLANGRLIDGAFLSELVGAIGLDAVREAMGLFREEATTRMAAIHRALVAGAVPTLRREAHALTGAALAVGLVGLGEAARALQRLTETTEPDAHVVQTLADLLDRTLTEVSLWEARQRAAGG